jgi:hypothetical protein
MKKVIAVAAGLMLTGALVTTASAAVSFSGDARIRGYYETDYDFGRTVPIVEDQLFPRTRTNEEDIKANSRYRVKINADAKGGAYVRSRIKIGDGVHGVGSKTDVTTDYMFVGVPMGPITVEGGRMPANVTKFFIWDARFDMIIGKWANDMTDLQFWYVKDQESGDLIDDDDITTYVGLLNQKFAGDWGLTVAGAYIDDQTITDMSGFTGTIGFSGPAGPISLQGEFSYADSDVEIGDDDGYGGYLEGGMDFGATSVTLNGGWAGEGFVADDDFGFIMLGGASSITPSGTARFGAFAGVPVDTTWIGGTVGFKASEALSLTGILAYADFDDFGDGFEISGRAVYGISDGANIQWDIGYLSWDYDSNILDDSSESPFGTALTLNVSF